LHESFLRLDQISLPSHQAPLLRKDHGLKNEDAQCSSAQKEGQNFDFQIVGLVLGSVISWAGIPLSVHFFLCWGCSPSLKRDCAILPMRGICSDYDKEQQ